MYDILIQNGSILDGTGSLAVKAQLAVKDGKIVKIAEQIDAEAKTVIDAAGKVVTPGFIDSHSHSDSQFVSVPQQTEKAEQGITTSVAGQCGGSVCGENAAEFLDAARGCALGANMALLIGHSTLRKAVMGVENREPTRKELEKMKDMLRSAMEHGALGVSFGLIYAPGCYAKTEELIEMAKVAAEYKGIAAIHLRSEGVALVESVQEFIDVVRASGVRGVLSHHKAAGLSPNWGKVRTTLQMIDRVNEEGFELYADMYPYVASHTLFSSAIIPADWRSAGKDAMLQRCKDPEQIEELKKIFYGKYQDMHWILISRCPGCPEFQGKRIPEIAEMRGLDEFDVALEVIQVSEDTANACFFSACEEDVETVMAHPKVMIGTDSGVKTPKTTTYHPRLRGSFPRVLGRYVRERKVTTLPEMIRKMTSLPAQVYGFKTKGLLREGMDADICIFDPDKIIDRAEYTNPHLHAEGLDYVIVGGRIAAVNAVATGEMGGTMLFRTI